ncbi:efflux RND transporter periplasmic adaptor subunit [Echinimonas agarilytica]|uniref:Efflux RND transporter periplasmic adaptor subunit n=1 Tax=Echinimonas agarilytica TaxID=1215918 RepID=A0AA41W418_9GAMM|nr:efflux RND transporter periplasmic adaptor subunit [Echinimonas agarilytica]MCM2678213.1 efflux RND transporter periplasmic adaptor subunit [Echinimonas agarilytica]
MKKWFAWMFVVVILLLGSVIGFNLFKAHMIEDFLANRPPPTFPVTTMMVSTSEYVPRINAFGFIEPYRGVTLAAEESGTVKALSFESGQTVGEGQLLVSLDSEVEAANLAASEAVLPATQKQMDRMVRLYKQGSVSEGEKDKAVADLLTLKAQIRSLTATIDRRTIEAPFAGQVGLRNVYMGQYLQPGNEIVRLEDTSTMRIRFTVPQNDLNRIHVKQAVHVNVDAHGDEIFQGIITAIEPAVSYQSGVVQVQADIPNDDGDLRSGMFARVQVILPTLTDQLLLPQSAINFTLYGENVFVVEQTKDDAGNEQLQVKQTTVSVSERHGNLALISSGLKEGDEVVTSGQIRLSNGSLVRLVESNALIEPDSVPRL